MEHKTVRTLREAWENDTEKAEKLSRLLFNLASMMAGLEIEDPAAFVSLVSELI